MAATDGRGTDGRGSNDGGLRVDLVSVEREVWSGSAREVLARTTEGELGILPGHTPLLGQLAEGGTVRVMLSDGGELVAAVHGGFLSVTDEGVTVLAEITSGWRSTAERMTTGLVEPEQNSSTYASVPQPRAAGSSRTVKPRMTPRSCNRSTRRLTAGADKDTTAPMSAKLARASADSSRRIASSSGSRGPIAPVWFAPAGSVRMCP